jgi:hypothetical protein
MYLIAAGSAVSLFTFRNIADFFRTNVLSAGGFTGTIRVDYNQGIGKNASSIIEVSYKINKGANKGGNKANVIYSDGGTLPIKTFNTGDAGIQNNQWNYLGGSYSRGFGSVAAKFIFDKSRASDPSCTVKIIF